VGIVGDTQGEQIANSQDAYLQLWSAPKSLLLAVGLGALAVAAWRRRAFSRGASIVLILAAVVSLIAPPWPGGVLAKTWSSLDGSEHAHHRRLIPLRADAERRS
jgi:hypothetical protein